MVLISLFDTCFNELQTIIGEIGTCTMILHIGHQEFFA